MAELHHLDSGIKTSAAGPGTGTQQQGQDQDQDPGSEQKVQDQNPCSRSRFPAVGPQPGENLKGQDASSRSKTMMPAAGQRPGPWRQVKDQGPSSRPSSAHSNLPSLQRCSPCSPEGHLHGCLVGEAANPEGRQAVLRLAVLAARSDCGFGAGQ